MPIPGEAHYIRGTPNMIRNIISMAKANPRWAVTALSLDAAIGTVFALVVFIILNLHFSGGILYLNNRTFRNE